MISDPRAVDVLENALLNAALSHNHRARMLLRELEDEGLVVVARAQAESRTPKTDTSIAIARAHDSAWPAPDDPETGR